MLKGSPLPRSDPAGLRPNSSAVGHTSLAGQKVPNPPRSAPGMGVLLLVV